MDFTLSSPIVTESLNTSDSQGLNQRNYFHRNDYHIIDAAFLDLHRIKSLTTTPNSVANTI